MSQNKVFREHIDPTPQGVKKFYLLDYFLILLQSCKVSEDYNAIFSRFKNLKEKERLGESKYKKLVIDDAEELSESQVRRYLYTFDQVISESLSYGLIRRKNTTIVLTKKGVNCLILAEEDKREFYNEILKILEDNYSAFYHLIKLLYSQNKENSGLFIFPIYSPRKLGFDKKKMTKNKHIIEYSKSLRIKLERDIESYLGYKKNLVSHERSFLKKLLEDNLLTENLEDSFNPDTYNALISRFRKFWLNFFLKKIYKYPYSFDTFNIWVERGKQLGVVHTTEFYPNFDGRLVYPTSVILKENESKDLIKSYNYHNGEFLFIHKPKWSDNQNLFFESIHNAYYDLKGRKRINFIRVSDLREKVCYRMKIPSFVFNSFLQMAYNQNLKGETKIQISLEADRLPQETNAMYLKREPVIINNQQKNIIAIDYKK